MFSLRRRRMSSRSSPWSVRGADGIAYTYIMISRSDPQGPLLAPDALLIDLGLDEPCQVSQRLLPTEITSLGWNDVWHACLRDIHLGADQYFLQRHRHLHLAGQIGIIEFVRVAQAFACDELDIGAAKRMAFARRE